MNRRDGKIKNAIRILSGLFFLFLMVGCFEYSLPMKQHVQIDLDKQKVTIVLKDLHPKTLEDIQNGFSELISRDSILVLNKGIFTTHDVGGFNVLQREYFEIDNNDKLNFIYEYDFSSDSSAQMRTVDGERYFAKWRKSNKDLLDVMPVLMVSNGEVIVNAKPFPYSTNTTLPDSLYSINCKYSIVKTPKNNLIVFPDSLRIISYDFEFKWKPAVNAKYDMKKLKAKLKNKLIAPK